MPAQPPRLRTWTRPAAGAAALAVFRALSEVEVPRAMVWERHRHADHEVILVGAGGYRCTVNGAALALDPGDALVVQPGDWHEDLLATGSRYHALWFHLPGGLLAAGIAAGLQVVRRPAGLPALVERLQRLAAAGAPAARLDLGLAEVLALLVDGLDPAARAGAFAAAGDGLRDRLHAAFARLPPGRADGEALARACGLPRRSLERRCRAELGCGPAAAHARWRLERAGELLLTTGWPVRAVSDSLGFANPFHFSRAFARQHGAAPAAWRERRLR
jgi:AraC-like DNA-binding protein